MEEKKKETLYFNGIDGETGKYLKQPRKFRLAPRVERNVRDARYDVNLKNLASTGWGVVFAKGDRRTSAIREALKPLLDLRRSQASAESPKRYKEFSGQRGYIAGERKQNFLERAGQGPGPVSPDRVPYYLLIVGSPEQIPYSFQYQLDVSCAVGRIHFDTVEEYARYAQSVVDAETRPPERPRKFVLFGAKHDPLTEISVGDLLAPLRTELRGRADWKVETFFGTNASKARLGKVLGGKDTPSLLFTAGHGVGFRCGGPRQKPNQGSLLCQDWPGKGHLATPDHYFSADDLSSSAQLRGLISFHFACYSAGTPVYDDFSKDGGRNQISPEAFIARLPKSMLSHPAGGALAVVGHVDQACQSSFLWNTAGSQVHAFADCLFRLQDHFPVGAALEPLNRRYAELAADLLCTSESLEWEPELKDEVSFLRTACRDARNYVIVGDPAVRLPAAAPPEKKPTTRG
ncbi:MAG TPA: hypothetical protein VH394_25255 [Thermoanaerobaculia bacterium]|jgi:hypothetical protein|nr:hypothetical protein [Thermoanaerobaculia bacterium]